MAIIQMKCTVCKRQIELPENKKGLEVINRCVITEQCRGTMYRIDRKQDFIRGDYPARVSGLTDYTPRRILYNHTQAISSTKWYITHNLGVSPSVQVVLNKSSTSEQELSEIPCVLRNQTETFEQVETTDFTIEITSPNTLVITFTDPQSGLAQMIARSSAPVNVVDSVETTSPSFQLSTGTLLSIATLNDTISSVGNVDISLTYTPPSNTTTISKTYTATPNTSTESPWFDYSEILIQGRKYKVRSFDAFVSEMSNGTIPNGSSFYFDQIGTGSPLRDIESREVILLLALSPYHTIDKIQNQIIDVNRITAENAALSLFYQDSELFAFTTIISSTFPTIREI